MIAAEVFPAVVADSPTQRIAHERERLDLVLGNKVFNYLLVGFGFKLLTLLAGNPVAKFALTTAISALLAQLSPSLRLTDNIIA